MGALYLHDVGQWVKTDKGECGYVVKIHHGGYSVHIPKRHGMVGTGVDTNWFTEIQLEAADEICEDAKKAFIDWALEKRYFDLLEG